MDEKIIVKKIVFCIYMKKMQLYIYIKKNVKSRVNINVVSTKSICFTILFIMCIF